MRGAAREYLQVALERVEYGDGTADPSAAAQVAASNAISAGIAATDAICGAVLGERANDQDHRSAVELLSTVEPGGSALASRLRRLLKDKSLLQYGGFCTPAVARTAVRDAQALVDALRRYGIRE